VSVVREVSSRHNDLFKSLRRLLTDPAAYRKLGQAWVEGDHLCRALLERGGRPLRSVIVASAWEQSHWRELAQAAPEIVRVPDALMGELTGLESAAPIGFLIGIPAVTAPKPGMRSVVLDRLQDPGNAGSILRSASAMGFAQVVALKGTVALWSPKVLRAGMGAHFGLALVEGASVQDLQHLEVPLVGTHLREAAWLHEAALPDPLAWVFGHEGQGMSDEVSAACASRVRIAQPGGEESLNVAAAAAICLYESARTRRGATFSR